MLGGWHGLQETIRTDAAPPHLGPGLGLHMPVLWEGQRDPGQGPAPGEDRG